MLDQREREREREISIVLIFIYCFIADTDEHVYYSESEDENDLSSLSPEITKHSLNPSPVSSHSSKEGMMTLTSVTLQILTN